MTVKRRCPKCQSQDIYYRHISRRWACPKCDPTAPEGSKASDDPPAPSKEEEKKAAKVRGDEKVTSGDTNVHDDVAAAIRALAAEEIGEDAALQRIAAGLQRSRGISDKNVIKVQVFNFARTLADKIFADFSSSKQPPEFVFNEGESCFETELELINDEATGKYWCGPDKYYLADAVQQIELRMGKVKIFTPERLRYRDLMVRRVIKVQVFNFGRTLADKIFADFSSSKQPPEFVFNEEEKYLEAELQLIYDKPSGKYWCGWDMYYLEDVRQQIELRMGEVKIITPDGVGYQDLIVRQGRYSV